MVYSIKHLICFDGYNLFTQSRSSGSSLQAQEFIDLRSKIYSLNLQNGRNKITANGVSRSHVFNNLKHNNYSNTLQSTKASNATLRTVTSHKHAVKTEEVNKVCLSAFDDKRRILPDGMYTLARGHFGIAPLNAEMEENN